MKPFRISLEVSMIVILTYLMIYQTVRGLMNHAVLGIAVFVIFIVHNIINYRWYYSLFKGRYALKRFTFVAINVLLLCMVILMIVSSVMMSGAVFSFSNIPMTQTARNLHVLSAAWLFMLVSLHLGLHTRQTVRRLCRYVRESTVGYAYYLLLFLLLGAGGACFVESGVWSDMALLNEQKSLPSEPLQCYAIYLGTIFFVCLLTYLLFTAMFSRRRETKPRGGWRCVTWRRLTELLSTSLKIGSMTEFTRRNGGHTATIHAELNTLGSRLRRETEGNVAEGRKEAARGAKVRREYPFNLNNGVQQ